MHMNRYVDYLPIAIIIMASISGGVQLLFKKEKKLTKIILFIVLLLLCSLQIWVNNNNKVKEGKRENADSVQKVSLIKKILTLNKGVDSLTNIVIFKEDGIKSFIEEYLLKDSAMRAKYDSFNKIDREKGHPELVILNPKLYKVEDRYFAGYTIVNHGERTATNIYLKEFVVSSAWDMYERYGSITLPASGALDKNLELKIHSLHSMPLALLNFNYPTYFYIEGTYCDADFKSIKYSISELFSTMRSGYNSDSSGLTICRPWIKTKIKVFLDTY